MTNQAIRELMRLNPAVQIFTWACAVFVVQALSGYTLIMLAVIFSVLAVKICTTRFYILLKRIRWILFSMFLIYAYTGQGTVLWEQLGVFSPLFEGLITGFEQLLRLISIIAGLSILLTMLSGSQLISGIYSLSRPLAVLGVSRDRFAVRIALTLRYVESSRKINENNWVERIEDLLQPTLEEPGLIELSSVRLSRYEWILLAVVLLMTVGTWL